MTKRPDVTEENTLDHAIDNIDISFSERLNYDKMGFYYISSPIMLVGNFLGALLLCAIQLGSVDLYSIGIWLLVSFVMFLYRFYHYYLFKRESEHNKLRDAKIWLDKYYTNTLLSGIVWGSSALLIFPESELLNQMVLVFFLFAIGFTAMGILASKRNLLLTYALVTYSPIIWRLFYLEGELYTKIAYIIFALTLIMILTANYYGKVINNALNNRQHFISIKHTHEKLKERFFSLFERAPVGIYYYNPALELQDVNMHFMHINKIDDKEELLNTDLHASPYQQMVEAHQEVFNGQTGSYRGPFQVPGNTQNLYVNLSTVPMLDAAGSVAGGITIIDDITNEVIAKEEMIRNAYYDMLTNIPNRTLLLDKLKAFLGKKRQNKEYAALLFLDINHFKKVNETYGHDIGDHLLQLVVKRVDDNIDGHEVFARITGNKFVILLPSLAIDKELSKEMTLKYINKIHDVFTPPFNLAGDEYHVNFTIGIVLFNDIDASAYDLLKRAETAMYEAKKIARGTNQFYQDSMSQETHESLMLENDMHKALIKSEFIVYYQPQLDIQKNKIVGAEALIRWNHPKKGFISPALFIPIAEESGTIIKLEEWIIDKTFREIKALSQRSDGFGLDHIAINISTVHFLQPHFVEKLMLLLQKHDVKAEWFELEITESGIMRNIADAAKKIEELKSFGFTFAIDDFGTGYSSLSYLKELPVDMVKIDQSFIRNMHESKGDVAIVEAVTAIAEKFNLKVLAEGVEDKKTLEALKALNCHAYQGYYAHKPMPLEDFEKLL
ncbi:bifunctional diguanylate cyclase/phosphodiesterase [Sulfurovum sp. XGS-02]|uniref:sensor domain-containing protein n=1 Tax=Sulfurovum sp. XGS-02 TaxID=2925411 RepID=UPI002053D58F|nr:bifunctional diguanylate cyclase/phosphodiesterase [Sulfurovum sp. XGS-02]UPT77118.1 bifunctional diguanylate cyclase/phosphodiesterase [Sulfurovum sp. XGS-02]